MRSKTTRRIAAALSLAVIFSTGLATAPSAFAADGDIVIPVPADAYQLSLSATRLAGVDGRGTYTAWLRDLADPGTEHVVADHARDAFVSVGRTAVNSSSGLVLTDQGKQVGKLSPWAYLWQLSGPYVLGKATTSASKFTVLSGSTPMSFDSYNLPVSIFGSRVAVLNTRAWEVRIYDLASGKPVQLEALSLDGIDPDYVYADAALWGDKVAITASYAGGGTHILIWDYFAGGSPVVLPVNDGDWVSGISDNVALVSGDDTTDEPRLLNLSTGASQSLPDSTGSALPAFDNAGRILYSNGSQLVLHQVPFAGSSAPRALWTSAATSFNSLAGDSSPWKLSVDATKAVGSGTLQLRGLDGLSGTTANVPVATSPDGSLRITWNGDIEGGGKAPAGTYEWELLGLDGLKAINGVATVNGHVTVTNVKAAYPQVTPLLDNLKPAVDATLTVNPGPSPDGASVGIQWYRDTTAIQGAIATTYKVVAGDVGHTIKAKVSLAASALYLASSKYSAVTAKVVKATITPSPVPVLDDPTPTVDQAVTGDIGIWGPDPIALSYQWYKVSSGGTSTAITNAKTPVFTPTGSEVGYKLKLKVTGTRSGYTTKSLYSALTTGKVAKAVFASVADPTITGSVKVGMPLTAVPGATEPTAKASYQWYRGATAISGATGSVYKTTSSDLGKLIKVRVTYSRSGYVAVPPRYFALTTPIEAGLAAVTPKLDDTTPAVGQVLRITEATGIGAWTPADATPTYQWYRDSSAIAGATGGTYEVQAADVGHTVKVKVTGAKDGYVSVAKTSAASSKVVKGVFTSKPRPTLDGTPLVGETVTAITAGWAPTPTSFSYVWYRSGAVISGKTQSTYALVAADLGKAITVKVTAVRAGFTSASATSEPITVVVAA